MSTSYTLEQLQSLEASIASGERRVKYEDREVEYRSLAEMRSIAEEMRVCLGVNVKRPNRTLVAFDKGHDQPGPPH